jgi:hypothetical protein
MMISIPSALLLILSISIGTPVVSASAIGNAAAVVGLAKGAVYCPQPVIGIRCPDSSYVHYYECCGDLSKDCCVRVQVWVYIAAALAAIMIVTIIIACIIACIKCICCCFRPSTYTNKYY